jgi:hypothetical protein
VAHAIQKYDQPQEENTMNSIATDDPQQGATGFFNAEKGIKGQHPPLILNGSVKAATVSRT